MKKLITMMIAVMIMAFSTVSAFAVSSPVAPPEKPKTPSTSVDKPDTTGKSPKTGSSDILAYTMIAVSALGCGVASFALAKSAKKN